MKAKLFGFALALLSVATIGVVQLQTKAYVDTTPDCDQYAVIKCGAKGPVELRTEYNTFNTSPSNGSTVRQGDIHKIFSALGISGAELSGDFKMGTVYQNGNVVVAGKVVATNARMAARNLGGNPIAGTGAGTMSVSHMGSAQAAMVKFDANGRFKFAVMTPCGNPVAATPTQPKPEARCDGLNVDKIERTKFKFTGHATAKNGANVKAYEFVVFKGSKQVDSHRVNTGADNASWTYSQDKAGDYRVRVTVVTSEGDKTNDSCVKQFTVLEKAMAICKALNVQTISRTKFTFTAKAEVERATVKGYDFKVYKGNTLLTTKSVKTSKLSASVNYTQTTAGAYTVKAVVKTSLGDRTNDCVKHFTVTPPQVNPIAKCTGLTVTTISDTNFRFTGTAEVSGGATISSYVFTVKKGNTVENTLPVNTTARSASITYGQMNPGTYNVTLVVKTSLGDRTGKECMATFTVKTPEQNPNIKVTKLVEGVKYKLVGVNVEYEYELAVTNTGDINLTNVVVTDTPDKGVTLVSGNVGTVSNNVWTYTIPSLSVGETKNFTLKAKVPQAMAGRINNTVCVNAPEVPGNPDDCDNAEVEVKQVPVCNPATGQIIQVDESEVSKYEPVDSPKCKEVQVCNPETGEIITVKKSEADKYEDVNSAKCKETPVTPTTPTTPTELPQTGMADVVVKLAGVTSLAGAGSYYLLSRRSRS